MFRCSDLLQVHEYTIISEIDIQEIIHHNEKDVDSVHNALSLSCSKTS